MIANGPPQLVVIHLPCPDPDDPAVQGCLNCELPDCARGRPLGCPFDARGRVAAIATGIARRGLAQAMKEMGR